MLLCLTGSLTVWVLKPLQWSRPSGLCWRRKDGSSTWPSTGTFLFLESGKNVLVLDVFYFFLSFLLLTSLHTEILEKPFWQAMSSPVFTPSQFWLNMEHDWAPHFHGFCLNLHSKDGETFAARSKVISLRDGPHSKGGCWIWWISSCDSQKIAGHNHQTWPGTQPPTLEAYHVWSLNAVGAQFFTFQMPERRGAC